MNKMRPNQPEPPMGASVKPLRGRACFIRPGRLLFTCILFSGDAGLVSIADPCQRDLIGRPIQYNLRKITDLRSYSVGRK
jgi:hypothetical protein